MALVSSPATLSFKWMDILEKEFDKSFVALEELFRGIHDEYELCGDVYEQNRKLLTSLGSCFVQVVHKAQTIFQNNAKFEAELIHLREELSDTRATLVKMDAEKQYLVCQLQSSLLENHKLRDKEVPSQEKSEQVCQDIQHKLATEMSAIERVDWDARKLEDKCRLLKTENSYLRRTQVELESELVGARLDSKYLDKELAGRIQQIQILLASGTSQDHKQKVWSQIESEMHLQRSKTISNMCYSKQRVKDSGRRTIDRAERGSNGQRAGSEESGGGASRKSSFNGHSPDDRKRMKQVMLHKNDVEELGMAILGGSEHGLPIMISEVFPNTAVGRCRKICAGDVILAVNGDSFEGLGHHEAVKYLSALRGTIRFDLENCIEDDTDEVCDMDNRFYDFMGGEDGDELEENAAAATAQGSRGHSGIGIRRHPGRAQPQQNKPQEQSRQQAAPQQQEPTAPRELPEVHHSPRKEKPAVEPNGV